MAVQYRTSLVAAVVLLKPVDMSVRDLYFPVKRDSYFSTPQVEFDIATVAETSAEYNSFAKQANVVKKVGFDEVKLYPLNINESIPITSENTKNRGVGEPKYGSVSRSSGNANKALQSELDGFRYLKARGDRKVKIAMYEALMTGAIVYGQDGIPVIDFNMPAGNKEVETGTDLWSDSGSDPIAKMISVYDSMSISPESATMSETAYAAFISHAKVLTTDNDSTGKKANFTKSDLSKVKSGSKHFKAGRLVDRPLDVYVEMDTYKNAAGTDIKYLTDGFVVFGSSSTGQLFYGGIPMSRGDSVVWVSADVMLKVDTKENPVSVDRIFQSAPLPVLKNAEGFYSLKVLS